MAKAGQARKAPLLSHLWRCIHAVSTGSFRHEVNPSSGGTLRYQPLISPLITDGNVHEVERLVCGMRSAGRLFKAVGTVRAASTTYARSTCYMIDMLLPCPFFDGFVGIAFCEYPSSQHARSRCITFIPYSLLPP